MPSAAQRTFNECSAEKPDVPKKSTPVRSSTNCVMRPEWLAAYDEEFVRVGGVQLTVRRHDRRRRRQPASGEMCSGAW